MIELGQGFPEWTELGQDSGLDPLGMQRVPSGMQLEFGLARSPGNMKVSFQAARSIG